MSGQLLPYARTAELLADLCGCPLSPGTLEHFVAEGAERLKEPEEQIKQALRTTEVMGTDETGVRVEGRLSRASYRSHRDPDTLCHPWEARERSD